MAYFINAFMRKNFPSRTNYYFGYRFFILIDN